MVAKNSPISNETAPFTGLPPEAKMPAVSPSTAIQKYSNDENVRAIDAMPVAKKMRRRVPITPPTADPRALMPSPNNALLRRASV